MLQICQSKQLSFQRRQHPTIWWLIIDSLRLCCLSHTFSLSVCLSVSPFPHSFSFPKIRHRLQHESCRPVFGSVTSDFAAGAMQPTPQPPPTPSLCCYGTCQVATGTLISPLIRLLNPGVDSIQPSFMSEKSRSKTPRCLTLQKLTRVPLPSSPLLCHLLQQDTLFFFCGSKKRRQFLTHQKKGRFLTLNVMCSPFCWPRLKVTSFKATFCSLTLLHCKEDVNVCAWAAAKSLNLKEQKPLREMESFLVIRELISFKFKGNQCQLQLCWLITGSTLSTVYAHMAQLQWCSVTKQILCVLCIWVKVWGTCILLEYYHYSMLFSLIKASVIVKYIIALTMFIINAFTFDNWSTF